MPQPHGKWEVVQAGRKGQWSGRLPHMDSCCWPGARDSWQEGPWGLSCVRMVFAPSVAQLRDEGGHLHRSAGRDPRGVAASRDVLVPADLCQDHTVLFALFHRVTGVLSVSCYGLGKGSRDNCLRLTPHEPEAALRLG